jgi:hypothetical protein
MKVRSQVDFWSKVLIWGTVLILLVGILITPPTKKVIGFLISTPIIVFLLWMYFGTYYELRDKYLYCRCGPLVEKIPYEKIKTVKLSQNLFSSMALSRERLEIRQHGKGHFTGTTYISPINRQAFMDDLIKRCDNLK